MKKLFLSLFVAALSLSIAYAQEKSFAPSDVKKAAHFRKTPPLREMTIILPGERDRSWKDGLIRNEMMDDIYVTDHALPNGPDPVAQRCDGTKGHKGPKLNMNGIGNVNGLPFASPSFIISANALLIISISSK